MANYEIRNEAKSRGVRLWEIAMRLGINGGNFSRRLRSEFSPADRERVLRIIREIASERGAEQ